MKIGIGSDHGGFELKEYLKEYLKKQNIEYIDYGTNSLESVDYPDFALKVAEGVVNGECNKGIVVCGTGIGVSISCNKVRGIRCALLSDTYSARMSAEHNNANVIALGGRVIGKDLAVEIVSAWLKSESLGGRRERRINKISDIEAKYML